MSDATNGIEDFDAKRVMEVCGDVLHTKALIAWMEGLVQENVALQVLLVESAEEKRETRLCHLASQISSYRRIMDAANRALNLASGEPPKDEKKEPAMGGVL
ncbi:MAG: hypothetical protein ACI4QT_10505 [Kiritimatiellia bacterium]